MQTRKSRTPARSCSRPDAPATEDPIQPHRYYIALGSNVGDREGNLLGGWDRLCLSCLACRLSRVIETRPQYVADQPLYLNAVGEVTSALTPRRMLERIHGIERDFGRDRSREIRMGPRTLDLDILLCDQLILDEPDLIIPHPRITERLFVLAPLVELAPDLKDPRTSIPYAQLLEKLEKHVL